MHSYHKKARSPNTQKYNLWGCTNEAPNKEDKVPSVPNHPTLQAELIVLDISKKFHDRKEVGIPKCIALFSGRQEANCLAIHIFEKGNSGNEAYNF
ncbi:MAG: hypothetical protein LUE99_14830 [Bacteroides sp.]|nr:hypothetical protein [Bacteroides sp.]